MTVEWWWHLRHKERCRDARKRYRLLFELPDVREWGSVDATNGVLVSADRGTRVLAAPFRTEDGTLIGDGWKVTVRPGWVVRPEPRSSDFQIVRDGR
jgi:hypothetical protein